MADRRSAGGPGCDILAWEAVTRGGSVCAQAADGTMLAAERLPGESAAAHLVPALDAILRRHGRPSALAVAVGPGSFTGLRIAVVAARTLGWLDEIPVHPVDTLAAIAAAAGPGDWWVWQPLKRDVTFHGRYRVVADRVTVVQGPVAQDDAQPPLVPDGVTIVGPALVDKPDLHAAWAPACAVGSAEPVAATGVAGAAASFPALAWSQVLPQYRRESAPVLQRRRGES